MIRELGIVSSIQGQHIEVKTQIKSGCSGCSHQSHCGTGLLSKAMPHREGIVSVYSTEPLQIGDSVELLIPEQDMMVFSFLMYGLPLVGLVVGASLGYWLQPQEELTSILLGLLGSGLTFGLLKAYFRRRDIRIQKSLSIKAVD
ncbi:MULTISPECIES: SoxR reducing system RseC family protein [Gammaproteobacteria]|uniref:SoxR reducing system RseC family protein n=1 Tax=Gammaproteobacteria TaxID=1236 RepID=UPI000DCF7A9A|nr:MULTISPECIES: SoxR reducing system RseC family protein [Gammaproteobacteria]RTE87106.1 Fis family transcriptional regulator [Aliidiomarina sp. B3213]TCZ93106.1 Fis family transcriptional regulator [Lysobacter sp. N42]